MNNSKQAPRRQMALVGAWNTIQLDYRSPAVITFWSVSCGGLGHILLDRYFRGFILVAGEIFLNSMAHVNTAIFYTINGHFNRAAQVLDERWLFLYLAVYCFAIFDSYRETIVINNTFRLADRENAEITSFAINSSSFSILNNVPPYLAIIFSAVLPGTGCFLIQRMNRALYLMILWIGIAGYSGVYLSVLYTLAGEFELAKQAVNIQWAMNLPSLWFFAMYESYQCALENNKLYRRELMQYFQRDYQHLKLRGLFKEA